MTNEKGEEEDVGAHLSVDDVLAELGRLTSADLKKLDFVGIMLTRGMALTAGELFSDAVQATVEGRRLCPKDVLFIVFLKNVMKSLASSARISAKRSKVVPFPLAAGDDRSPIDLFADASDNPEEALIAAEDEKLYAARERAAADAFRVLNAQFSDDYDAQLCLAGWEAGQTSEEQRELIGVDQAGLDYLRKKIRRVSRKLFPNGWAP
jgi:hypothetical protein